MLAEWRLKGREAFLSDPLLQAAIMWRIQTLAESVGQLSGELQSRHPEIPWRDIRGFRNLLVHRYLDLLDPELAWAYVTNDVDALGRLAEDELGEEPDGSKR